MLVDTETRYLMTPRPAYVIIHVKRRTFERRT